MAKFLRGTKPSDQPTTAADSREADPMINPASKHAPHPHHPPRKASPRSSDLLADERIDRNAVRFHPGQEAVLRDKVLQYVKDAGSIRPHEGDRLETICLMLVEMRVLEGRHVSVPYSVEIKGSSKFNQGFRLVREYTLR